MSVDLVTNSVWCAMGVDNVFWVPAPLQAPSYGSDWVFDGQTKISICSDSDQVSKLECTVQNLKVWYSNPTEFQTMAFSNRITILADYKFNENTLINSIPGSIGAASLSPTIPLVWTSDFGLEFGPSGIAVQYLQIPNFIPQGQDMWLTASLGFGFYIKIDEILTEYTDIFSYWSDQNSAYPYPFALQIKSDLKLKTFIGPVSALLPQSLTLGKWASVYIIYSFTAGGYGFSKAYINGVDAGGFADTTNGIGHSTFSTNDIVRVGGFIGHLRRLRIFSPAAIGMNKGSNLCNPDSCLAEIGFNEIPVCMSATCDDPKGFFPSFGTCERKNNRIKKNIIK